MCNGRHSKSIYGLKVVLLGERGHKHGYWEISSLTRLTMRELHDKKVPNDQPHYGRSSLTNWGWYG